MSWGVDLAKVGARLTEPTSFPHQNNCFLLQLFFFLYFTGGCCFSFFIKMVAYSQHTVCTNQLAQSHTITSHAYQIPSSSFRTLSDYSNHLVRWWLIYFKIHWQNKQSLLLLFNSQGLLSHHCNCTSQSCSIYHRFIQEIYIWEVKFNQFMLITAQHPSWRLADGLANTGNLLVCNLLPHTFPHFTGWEQVTTTIPILVKCGH